MSLSTVLAAAAVVSGGLLLCLHERIGRLDEAYLRESGYPLPFVRFVGKLARNVAAALGVFAPGIGMLALSGGRGGATACAGTLLMGAGLLLVRFANDLARFDARLYSERQAPAWFVRTRQVVANLVSSAFGLLGFSLGLLLLLLGINGVSLPDLR